MIVCKRRRTRSDSQSDRLAAHTLTPESLHESALAIKPPVGVDVAIEGDQVPIRPQNAIASPRSPSPELADWESEGGSVEGDLD